jgi:hypothetical protein
VIFFWKNYQMLGVFWVFKSPNFEKNKE